MYRHYNGIRANHFEHLALCVDAGYTSCCTDENCEVRVETSPVSCFCDAACHDYNDCCSDILDIGCTDYCGWFSSSSLCIYTLNYSPEKHPCGILPYIVVGVTEGVDTFSVPAFDDGVSEPVEVAFPIGQSIKPFVQVCIISIQLCLHNFWYR